MDLLRELAEPFERMTPAEASGILRELYGTDATALELLETERDDTFRVSTTAASYVLKIAHPDDDPLYVNLQTAAMSFAAEDPTLPVQSLVLTLDGEVEPVITHAGRERVVRLLTWLDGAPLAGSATDTQLRALGATLGRLSEALSTFMHPAAQRTFAWDLQSFAELREHEHPVIAAQVFDRFAQLDLKALPRQVIHNDFHPGNVLVEGDDIVGILDFGDVVHSARVADLGVSLAYFLPESGDTSAVTEAFVAGYESVRPLQPEERAAIPTLVAARLVQRIMLPPIVSRDSYDPTVVAHMTRALENYLKEN